MKKANPPPNQPVVRNSATDLNGFAKEPNSVGATGEQGSTSSSDVSSKSVAMQSADNRFTTRVVILGILFGVTGALGLPALWWTTHFSTREKLFWSAIVILYTTVLIAGTVAICWWALQQIFPSRFDATP